MFQDLAVCVADLDKASGIAEFLRLVRHKIVEGTIKAVSDIAEPVGMIDGLSLHDVEYVNVGPECLGKGDGIYCGTGGRGGEIGGIQNVPEEVSVLSAADGTWGPTVRTGHEVERRMPSATEPMISRSTILRREFLVRSATGAKRAAQIRDHLLRITF